MVLKCFVVGVILCYWQSDALTMVKCLTIISEMLEKLPLQTLTPTLHMLVETQVTDFDPHTLVMNLDPHVNQMTNRLSHHSGSRP